MTPEELASDLEARADQWNAEAKQLLANGHYAVSCEQNIIARTLRQCAEEVRELGIKPGMYTGLDQLTGALQPGGCVPRTDFVCGTLGRRKLSSDESEWARWCDMFRAALATELRGYFVGADDTAYAVCNALKTAGSPK